MHIFITGKVTGKIIFKAYFHNFESIFRDLFSQYIEIITRKRSIWHLINVEGKQFISGAQGSSMIHSTLLIRYYYFVNQERGAKWRR